jgi:hypothetical protein
MLTETQYHGMTLRELADHLQREFDTPLTDVIAKRLKQVARQVRAGENIQHMVNP